MNKINLIMMAINMNKKVKQKNFPIIFKKGKEISLEIKVLLQEIFQKNKAKWVNFIKYIALAMGKKKIREYCLEIIQMNILALITGKNYIKKSLLKIRQIILRIFLI